MSNETTGVRKHPARSHTDRVLRSVDSLLDWLVEKNPDEDADVLAQALAIHIVIACKKHDMEVDTFIEGAKAWVSRQEALYLEQQKQRGVA